MGNIEFDRGAFTPDGDERITDCGLTARSYEFRAVNEPKVYFDRF